MQLSPVEWVVLLTSLISGTLGALGIGTYLYFRARANVQAHRRRQAQHLARLQRLTSKLLNACDYLLGSGSPEETVLYQRFKANGGEYYPDIQADVYEALSRSQLALNAAFELHQKLIDGNVQQTRSLEEQIRDWEILYAALVGQSEHIQNLTGTELVLLLDPMAAAGQETPPTELVEQLEDLRRELTDKPLKVRWQQIFPGEIRSETILAAIHRIKTQLAYLPERHKQEAPYWLAEARSQRRTAEAEIPSFWSELYRYVMAQSEEQTGPSQSQAQVPFEPGEARFFIKVDARLAQAEAAQTMGRFFEVIRQAYAIWQDMDTLKAFLKAMTGHARRQAKIDTFTARGYHPPNLHRDLQEIKWDVQAITGRILEEDFLSAAPWIEELNTDSRRMLAETQSWQALHEQNSAELASLCNRVEQKAGRWADEVKPAWDRLQRYTSSNWSDLKAQINQAQQTFNRIRTEQLEELESLNSLAVQQLPEAERLLAYVTADLTQIEQQFQTVLDRLAEVQTAETHLPEALRLAEADLARAERLRDREDVKIGAEVDRQIEQAGHHLAEANRLQTAGEFLTAIEEQGTARKLATAAYVAADEQVRTINALQTTLERTENQVQGKVDQALAEVDQLSVVVETASTRRLVQQLQAKEAAAKQARLTTVDLEDRALAQGLQAAIEMYETLGQYADWVAQQLATDQAEYDQLLSQTLAAIAEAQAALKQAKEAVKQADGSDARQRALYRAELALPTVDDSKQATREALRRMHQQAEAVTRYAQQGTRLVQRKGRLSAISPPKEPEKVSRPRLRRLDSGKIEG